MNRQMLLRRRSMIGMRDKPWLDLGIELEAIEATGTQYIDTDIDIRNFVDLYEDIYKWELCLVDTSVSSYETYLGFSTANRVQRFATHSFLVFFGYSVGGYPILSNDYTLLSYDSESFLASANDSSVYCKYVSGSTSVEQCLTLFTGYVSDGVRDVCSSYLFYGFTFSAASELKVDLIPFQLHSGEIGVLDKQTYAFYGGSGEGSLIAHYKS